MHFSGVCLERNLMNPLPSLILVDTEVFPTCIHTCAPCFSRLCFETNKVAALDEKYSEDSEMLLLQLKHAVFASVLYCDDLR